MHHFEGNFDHFSTHSKMVKSLVHPINQAFMFQHREFKAKNLDNTCTILYATFSQDCFKWLVHRVHTSRQNQLVQLRCQSYLPVIDFLLHQLSAQQKHRIITLSFKTLTSYTLLEHVYAKCLQPKFSSNRHPSKPFFESLVKRYNE